MSKPTSDSGTQNPASWFICCICWITGTDPEILVNCPRRDLDQVVTVAIIQLAAFVWQTLVFALAAHVMLAKPGTIRPDLVAISLLLATIIGLIDSYMIIRSSWFLHGLEELKRAGLTLPGSVAARIKNAFFVVVRIGMASVSAFLVGAVISILVFAKDINSQLDATYQIRNSQLIDATTRQYDQGTGELERSRLQIETQLARDTDSTRQVGISLSGPEADRIQSAVARITKLEAARSAAENELHQAQTFASDELAGVRHDRRNSGIPGRGALRLAAEERRRQADDSLRAVDRDLSIERKRLDDLRQSAAVLARQQSELVGPRLSGIEAVRQQHVRELADLDAKLAARRTARAAAIQDTVEHSSSFRPRDDGLLACARALVVVAQDDPWTRSLIIALDLFFFIVELAAVIVKTTTFVPSDYARTLASEESLRAHQISEEIAKSFNLHAKGTPPVEPEPGPLSDGEKHEFPGRNSPIQARSPSNGHADVHANGSETPIARRPRGRPPSQPRTLPPAGEEPYEIYKPKPDDGTGLFGPNA